MSQHSIELESIYSASYLNLINHIILDLEIPQTINTLVPYDSQCKVSPGEMVQCILLDILTGRQAMVHLESWAEGIDIEKLISPHLHAPDFNDDAIGRHLDRIDAANVHQVISEITLQIFKKEGNQLLVFHGDTTSKSVYGAYEIDDENEDILNITEGYSRDRQGAKQFQYGLIVDKNGIIAHGDVHDGNTSDKEWNPDVLKKLGEQTKKLDLSNFLYIGDSAAMSEQTLKAVKGAGGFLLTRGGNNLKIVKQALKSADVQEEAWSGPFKIGESTKLATYRVQEHTAEYKGFPVRLIVVESDQLNKKKLHTLEKQREREKEEIEKAKKEWQKKEFHCEEDAKKALIAWEKKPLHFHLIEIEIQQRQVEKRKKGRPKKSDPPSMANVFHVVISNITPVEEWFQEKLRKASRFVLVTTLPSEFQGLEMNSTEILKQYKDQKYVEMNFSFLKDPFFVDEIYLKKPGRVRVLAYLFMLALVIYNVFQKRIREKMEGQKPLIGAAKRKLTNPTGRSIFQMFKYIQVVVLRLPTGERIRKLGRPLTDDQRRVLEYLGLDESVFT